jgi:23S rRNA pseudouridine1911/1915/1917 synthase
MVTHPASGNWSGTLVNALLWHWGRAPIASGAVDDQARLRPGIVHRLDKDTSGVIIAARTREAEEWLAREFQRGARERYTRRSYRVPRRSEG